MSKVLSRLTASYNHIQTHDANTKTPFILLFTQFLSSTSMGRNKCVRIDAKFSALIQFFTGLKEENPT